MPTIPSLLSDYELLSDKEKVEFTLWGSHD